jgi:uncharacterized membrane protein
MLDALKRFRPLSLLQLASHRKPVKNVNEMQRESLSPLERAALVITTHVGTMGFFLLIFLWTILWCGYNILATKVSSLHWKPFDPFPAMIAMLEKLGLKQEDAVAALKAQGVPATPSP